MATILEPTEENLRNAADCIRTGGVVVAPSDTNLALTLDPWNEAAIERAFEIKERPPNKPLTIFVRDPEDWREYGVDDSGLAEAFVEAFWPGPLNVVVERTDAVPDPLVCGGETVAIGCLGNPTWRRLADHAGQPLAMTSANISGRADGRLVDLDLAVEQVGDRVDYVIEGGARGTTKSSTIVDLTGERSILRRGDITAADLNRVRDVF